MVSNAQGSLVKALLVEDIAVCTFILSTMLRRFNCEILVVKNGKEAMDLFLEGKKFDIVLCDKDLPIMSGTEAVEKIRAMGETNVKIVGVSGDDNAMEAFMSAGADVFMYKPMKLETLGTMIQEFVCLNMVSNAHGSLVKALLVEDIAVCTFILSTMLRRFNCEILVVKNGKEAIDQFLEGKKFDIVLCDKYLPIMFGPEAVEKICAMGETDVKIVGVSGDDNAMEAFMSVCADVFVYKPMKLETLGTMIQEVINKKNAMV
ncbi:hypothetical protein ACQ4PT_048662 [Festuca glaucescens]